MANHELKSWPEYFEAICRGIKPFELRKNDRRFEVGDLLHLREWSPDDAVYTGRECWKRVTYALHGVGHVGAIEPMKGLHQGYVILGLGDV